MQKFIAMCAVVATVLALSGMAQAAPTDLTDLSGFGTVDAAGLPVYTYDIPSGAYDIIKISFDYSCGIDPTYAPNHAAFRIRRLNNDTTDSWLGSFNIHSGSYNLDTDYGPSVSSGPLPLGVNHYEFTMNRSNGEWDLALNGTPGVLVGPAILGGANYFSDESPEAYQNALGTIFEPYAGIGGTGAYRLQFGEAEGGSLDNINVTCVPVPGAFMLGGLGLTLVGGLRRRKAL